MILIIKSTFILTDLGLSVTSCTEHCTTSSLSVDVQEKERERKREDTALDSNINSNIQSRLRSQRTFPFLFSNFHLARSWRERGGQLERGPTFRDFARKSAGTFNTRAEEQGHLCVSHGSISDERVQ